MTTEPTKCDRCHYDDAEPGAHVPDYYQNRYDALCTTCQRYLERRQAKLQDWGEY